MKERVTILPSSASSSEGLVSTLEWIEKVVGGGREGEEGAHHHHHHPHHHSRPGPLGVSQG